MAQRRPHPLPLALLLPLVLGASCFWGGAWSQQQLTTPQGSQVPPQVSPYCSRGFLWQPDDARFASAGSWAGKYFMAGPCTGVSGIGTTETYMKTILIIDRTDFVNTYMPMPELADQIAYAQEINLNGFGHKQRALNVLSNSFCSSGQHTKGGNFFSIGGDLSQGGYIAGEGAFAMRLFQPCSNGTCDFQMEGRLAEHRWYPTTQLLADGRVLVVGGSNKPTGINDGGKNIPSLEYYPNPTGVVTQLGFLQDTLPYNLYPIVHLLPNGQVFMFAGNKYILFDTNKNEVVPGNYPPLESQNENGVAVQHMYPLTGTSAMFPLHPLRQWAPEIIICGGASVGAWKGSWNKDPRADNRCFRISPLARSPQWAEDYMRLPRVLPLSVLLPDGSLFIHGGAQEGYAGIPNTAHKAVLAPEIYDTFKRRFRTDDLGVSRIPRVYHASAVLLHDATVFLSGSNPHQDGIQVSEKDYPTEFRTEFYHPPYMRLGLQPPVILSAPSEVAPRRRFFVFFKAHPGAKQVSFVLAQPGFSTHGNNQGMRNVHLQMPALRSRGGLYTALLAGPPNKHICPPTFYWLFVVVDGVPNRDGHHVFMN